MSWSDQHFTYIPYMYWNCSWCMQFLLWKSFFYQKATFQTNLFIKNVYAGWHSKFGNSDLHFQLLLILPLIFRWHIVNYLNSHFTCYDNLHILSMTIHDKQSLQRNIKLLFILSSQSPRPPKKSTEPYPIKIKERTSFWKVFWQNYTSWKVIPS